MRKFLFFVLFFAILLIISAKQALAQVVIDVRPPLATPQETILIKVTGLPEDGIYAITVAKAGQPGIVAKKCDQSGGKEAGVFVGPLAGGDYSVSLQKNINQTTTAQCDGFGPELESATFQVKQPVQPPPGGQPPPAAGGAIDFSKLEQAIGLKVGGKTAGITVGDIVTSIVPILFVITGLILLLYLIWGGFSLMLSKGDPKAVESAKGRITSAIIGFVIIFIAYWLVQFLGTILGIKQFEGIFGK